MKRKQKAIYLAKLFIIVLLLILLMPLLSSYSGLENESYGNKPIYEAVNETNIPAILFSDSKLEHGKSIITQMFSEYYFNNVTYDKYTVQAIEKPDSAVVIDQNELYMLSHLIYAEGGGSFYEDKLRYYIGSVVLNRMASDLYPDSMADVIFQDGQYECTWVDTYYNEPNENCIEIAKYLLTNGSVLPENVLFQAEFEQGDGTYDKVGNTYLCYIN